jgi:hypothetical protein
MDAKTRAVAFADSTAGNDSATEILNAVKSLKDRKDFYPRFQRSPDVSAPR